MIDTPPQRPLLDKARLAKVAPRLRVEVLDEVASTNAEVAARARAGEAEGLVVTAEHQTSGRGRLDRSWETPPRAALVFSVLLRPTAPPASWPWLPLLTGYAVSRALGARGYDVGLKWPNDVLIGSRKVAGILVERVEGPDGPAAVVGIGLNVDLTADELPVPTATSLALEGGAPDRTELLVDLLLTLRREYDDWQAAGAAVGEDGARRLWTAYSRSCVTLGREVKVDLPAGGTLLGRATEVDQEGRLVVAGPDGPQAVGAGDVVHVRATVT